MPGGDFPVSWSPALPSAAPGPREILAVKICVDPWRSANRLGVRSYRPRSGTSLVPSPGLSGMLPRPTAPRQCRGGDLARPGQRQQGARRTAPRKQQSVRQRGDVFSVLSRTVREVEAAARRGVTPAVRGEVPERRPAAARRARPRAGGGRKRQPPGRAAQAPRRHRGHPRRDRRPGRRAARPAGRGLRRLRRRPVAQARDGARPARRAGPRGSRVGQDRRADSGRPADAGRPAVGDLPAAGEPVPRPRLLGRSAARAPSRAASPAGNCSARC